MMLRLPFGSVLGISMVLTALAAAACSSDESGDSTTAGPGGSSSQTSAGNGGSGATGGASTTQASSGATSSSGQGGSAGGASGDTWGNYAMGFFATYCIECHGAGDAQRDYTMIGDVKTDSVKIRCGVAPTKLSDCASPPPKQFPIDNASGTNMKPDDAERARLVAWIEAGLPE